MAVDLDELAALPDLARSYQVEPGDVVRVAWSLKVAHDLTAAARALDPIEEVGPAFMPGPWLVSEVWPEFGSTLDLEELRPARLFAPRALLAVPRYAVQPLAGQGGKWREVAELARRRRHRAEVQAHRRGSYRHARL